MKLQLFSKALPLAAGALLVGSVWAQADSALPEPQRNGDIEYLSGGVGLDESTAFKNESRKWPLTLEFAIHAKPRAEYASAVDVVVSDARNPSALEVKTDGPFLLAKLPPGNYRVEATLAGKRLTRQVHVVPGRPARVEFLWPAGTDESPS